MGLETSARNRNFKGELLLKAALSPANGCPQICEKSSRMAPFFAPHRGSFLSYEGRQTRLLGMRPLAAIQPGGYAVSNEAQAWPRRTLSLSGVQPRGWGTQNEVSQCDENFAVHWGSLPELIVLAIAAILVSLASSVSFGSETGANPPWNSAHNHPPVVIRLRGEVVAVNPIVKLADLAELSGSDAAVLAAMGALELGPAPLGQTPTYLSARQLYDFLLERGFGPDEFRVTGSKLVKITRGFALGSKAAPLGAGLSAERFEDAAATDLTHEINGLTHEIKRYLAAVAANHAHWHVQPQITPELRAALQGSQIVAVSARNLSLPGPQKFEIRLARSGSLLNLEVTAYVEPALSVVVAARNLPRGTVLSSQDLTTDEKPSSAVPQDYVAELAAALGSATVCPIAAGEIITAASLAGPNLVRRGEFVTVWVRRPGIRVRTLARARQDGSQGQIIPVEVPNSRSIYLVRVCGYQEAEALIADSASVSSAGEARLANAAEKTAEPVAETSLRQTNWGTIGPSDSEKTRSDASRLPYRGSLESPMTIGNGSPGLGMNSPLRLTDSTSEHQKPK